MWKPTVDVACTICSCGTVLMTHHVPFCHFPHLAIGTLNLDSEHLEKMSRAYRKLLRERDALASTTTPDIKTNDTSEDENDDDGTIVQTQKPSLFALVKSPSKIPVF